MRQWIIRLLYIVLLFSTDHAFACGTSPNAMIQGPFKAQLFREGDICFQWSEDHRNIEFYADIWHQDKWVNQQIDSYEYTDGPVELLSVFFTTIKDKPYIMVLLRWFVNYQQGDHRYPYFYKIKAYQRTAQGYQSDPAIERDPALSGYQMLHSSAPDSGNIQQSHPNFELKDASKIRHYLQKTYQ